MPQVINTNVASLNAQRNLNNTQMVLQKSLTRLSSGLRINSAKDDSAGLAIATRFSAQINGLNQAVRNANDGISLAQTAEGALQEIATNLQRIRELAVQAANGTYSTGDRKSLQGEVSSLQTEIVRVIQATDFNGVKVLNTSSNLQFQIGAFGTTGGTADGIQTIQLNVRNVVSANGATGIGSALNNTSLTGATQTSVKVYTAGTTGSAQQAMARSSLAVIDGALDIISSVRADFGTVQNRFESVVRNLQNVAENLSASNSRIMDADFAAETASLTRSQILQQAGVAMLAQANAMPQSVLSLLG